MGGGWSCLFCTTLPWVCFSLHNNILMSLLFLHRPGGAKSPVSVPHYGHWTVAAAASQLAVMTRPLQITMVTRSL